MQLHWITALVLTSVISPAIADTRQAAEKAVPATVEIELRISVERKNEQVEVPLAVTPSVGQNDVNVPAMGGVRFHLGSVSATTDFVSGTIVSAGGLIVSHGILNRKLTGDPVVRFHDGRKVDARIIVRDERSGLVMLKVDVKDLPDLTDLEIATDPASIGQGVATVVNSHGYRNTFLRGIISGLDRTVKVTPTMPPAIQTDIQAGPGSSGGPLVNLQGELIGILATVPARGTDNASISFAVPSVHVRRIMDEETGDEVRRVKRGHLGIALGTAGGRPVVSNVLEGSPAESVGIKQNDELISINGNSVESIADVISRIGSLASGQKVVIQYRRGESQDVVSVRLTEQPDDTEVRHSGVNLGLVANPSGTLIVSPVDGSWKDGLTGVRITPEGTLRAIPLGEWTRKASPPLPSAPSIRVERSNVEEKIDELSKNIQELQAQVARLADAVGSTTGNVSADESNSSAEAE